MPFHDAAARSLPLPSVAPAIDSTEVPLPIERKLPRRSRGIARGVRRNAKHQREQRQQRGPHDRAAAHGVLTTFTSFADPDARSQTRYTPGAHMRPASFRPSHASV